MYEYICLRLLFGSKYCIDKLMRRSFRWQLKWPQLPFANGLQIDSVMDPLKGAAALEDGAKKEKKLSYPHVRIFSSPTWPQVRIVCGRNI